jgi:two-component system copper resistance phosphate regulon response regulator CusR
MKILIVEDEPRVSDFLRQSLSEAGYDATGAFTQRQGEALWREQSPDLVILDLMLPDGSGMDLLRQVRRHGLQTPVLILTAKDTLPDRVAGLDAGGDDYLAKPFPLEELLARVRALLRRAGQDGVVYRCGDLEIDVRRRRVTRAGRVVFLSSTEFSLLELLAQSKGLAVSKVEILRQVWDDVERDANVVEVYINYLRHKLERGGAPRLIRTVRGRGYSLDSEFHEAS